MSSFNFGKSETLKEQLNTDCYFTTKNFITIHEKIVSRIKRHYDKLKKQYVEDGLNVQAFPKFTKRKVTISNSESFSFTTIPTWLYNRNVRPNDKNFITINDLFKNDEKIIQFFKFCNKNKIGLKREDINNFGFGSRLFDCKNEFNLSKKASQIKKNEIVLKARLCLFSYCLIDNRTSDSNKIFEKYFEPLNSKDNKGSEYIEDDNYTGEYNHYIGFYYSHYRGLKIKNFLLEFSRDVTNNNRHHVRQLGIFNINDFKENDLLGGEAEMRDDYMFCSVKDKRGRHLDITLALNGDLRNKKDNKYISAGIQGVSAYGHIFQLGALLIKVSEEQRNLYVEQWENVNIENIIDNKNLWILELFLATKRDTNYIFPYKEKNLTGLTIGNTQIASLKNISGTYKLWNFGKSTPDRVIQSRLIIEQDGTAIFYPFINEKDRKRTFDYSTQEMSLQISEIEDGKLNLIGTTYHGKSIMNIAIFDFKLRSGEGIIEGVFISTGYGDSGFTGGYTVMKKMKKEDPNFDIRAYSRNEMKELISTDKVYRDKIARLYSIWQDKTWKNISFKNRISYLRKIRSKD